MQEPVQLSLGVTLKEDTTFEHFYPGKNALALKALQAFAAGSTERFLLIWGSSDCGVSHLLQACCHSAIAFGANALYLPLKELKDFAPQEVLEGLDALDVVCIDDIEHVLGNAAWEKGLFHLYNRLKDAGKRLVIAGHCAPGAIQTLLPDLKSRILGCVIFQIHTLDDEEKSHALQLRASARGLELSDEVITFILNRTVRSTSELFQVLDRLDQASLQQQRKITVPFVKAVLGL